MADLVALFTDSATYFSMVPERNNLKLISKMISGTRIGVKCARTGSRRQYRGTKIAFPNDWANAVHWCCSVTSDVFYAFGTETDDGIEYKYIGNRNGSQIAGTIVFDPLTGNLIRQSCSSYVPYEIFELRALLAPPAIVNSYFACRLAEYGNYEYEAIVELAGEQPALFSGIRCDRDNGWARSIDLSRGVNASAYIYAKSRINSRNQIKYAICVYKRESRIAFDLSGNLISTRGEAYISPEAILALVRPRK